MNHNSEAVVVARIVGALTPAEQRNLFTFLDRVLEQEDAGTVLVGMWNKSQADWFLASAQIAKRLFTEVRNQLKA